MRAVILTSAAAVVILMCGLSLWFLSDEATRLILFNPKGRVVNEPVLGVTKRMALGEARNSLELRGWSLEFSKQGGSCQGFPYSNGEQIDTYSRDRVSPGIVCLVSQDDGVVDMWWFFGGP